MFTPHSFDLIIFDCDGTLVDSEGMHSHTASLALTAAGFPRYTPEYCLEHFVGVSLSEMCAIISAEEGVALNPEPIAAHIAQLRTGEEAHALQPIEGADTVLEALPHPRCVASNGDLPAITESLEATGLARFFHPSHIYSYRMAGRPKPAPDLFLYAAGKFEVRPERCLVIEDSALGMAAARAAGMKVALTLSGSHMTATRRHLLREQQPDAVLERFTDLLDVLGLG
jgi:HAD superfamily hydrolase (TIGR01509 family)